MDNANKQLTPSDFPKASTASKLYLSGVEKGSKLHELINALNRIATHGTHQTPNGTIMYYEGVCEHDDGFLCEHRLQWIVNFIRENFDEKLDKNTEEYRVYIRGMSNAVRGFSKAVDDLSKILKRIP